MAMTASVVVPVGEWIAASPEETHHLGSQLGASLAGGEILLLDGPLGAGKTIFVKGVALALDIDETEVTSPSFTLVNRYEGRLTLYHLDLYRLPEGAAAAHAVDLDELLADERAIIIIEWAARMGRYPLPSTVWHVSITGDGEEPRHITVTKGRGMKDERNASIS
ncbi:MAG TPA: tRNA (adenosine(37)-N6)-threonylcarbamoyltransferase complex ATPase subunit type 1 TsaE [Pyrinomonadaceae bacterium]|jgi:tRNA threonylcarbamoyladenosine biosynthesis protein TsaE|nr:tRNA (adenosine(37)-N6)-threonylcarbamoyltransferase complex ATPase subunit type 1 TsaE [Pyrinomonadaceae bacterium]